MTFGSVLAKFKSSKEASPCLSSETRPREYIFGTQESMPAVVPSSVCEQWIYVSSKDTTRTSVFSWMTALPRFLFRMQTLKKYSQMPNRQKTGNTRLSSLLGQMHWNSTYPAKDALTLRDMWVLRRSSAVWKLS